MTQNHLDDGQLRTALDGELTNTSLQVHLGGCAACQARLEQVRAASVFASEQLGFLQAGAAGQAGISVPSALRRFYSDYVTQQPDKEISMFKRIFASSAFRVSAIAILLLALVISIPSTRALADQLLSLFRVQQVTVVPVDFTGMQQLTGNSAIGRQVSALISDSTVVTQKPGDPQSAVDAADASQKAGFSVRLPAGQTPSSLNVMGATSFEVTVNRAKAQSLLDEAGRTDLVLPASVDGAVISVHIPASVSAGFGTCPAPSADGKSPAGRGSLGRQYPDCLIFSEIPSPLVTTPAGVDVSQLAQIGFEFSGMTSEQAASFSKSIDFSTTLVLPIPRNAAAYDQISVDGVTGTLIKRPADDAPEFLLLWVKNGIVYAIGGLGADTQRAIDLANSLP